MRSRVQAFSFCEIGLQLIKQVFTNQGIGKSVSRCPQDIDLFLFPILFRFKMLDTQVTDGGVFGFHAQEQKRLNPLRGHEFLLFTICSRQCGSVPTLGTNSRDALRMVFKPDRFDRLVVKNRPCVFCMPNLNRPPEELALWICLSFRVMDAFTARGFCQRAQDRLDIFRAF